MKNVITLIFVLCTSLSVFSNVAIAQSIPLLTDPIKVREVELMSNRLDMTLAQQEALLGVYDTYLEDFSRVRQGEIKAFEDGIAEAAETFGFMRFKIPERAMIEDLIRKAERAIRAIHRSDNLFFEEVTGMLSEKQRIELKRIQIARELEAYQIIVIEMLGQLNNGARSQLRTLYNQLGSEPTVEINDLLDTYDLRYLKESKEGFEAVISTIRIILDQIDELGIRGMDQQALMMRFMSDPEAIEDLKRRGEILLKPLVDQAYAMSQLNWKTWNRLDSLLEEEDSQQLQDWYFGKSFRDSIRGGNKISKNLVRSLELTSINEGQRIDLEELQKSFHSKWPRMTENHAEVLEKSREKQTIAMMSGEVSSGFEEQLKTLDNTRRDYITKMTSRIESILGKEIVAKLNGDNAKFDNPIPNGVTVKSLSDSNETGDSNAVEVQVVVGSTDGRELTAEEIEELKKSGHIQTVELQNENGEWVDDQGQSVEIRTIDSSDSKGVFEVTPQLFGGTTIPKPISPSFPQRAAVVLDFDDSGVTIIEAVYNEYREKYDEQYRIIANDSKKIIDDESLSRAERMRKNNDLSKRATDAVASLDTALFDDLVAVTSLKREDVNVKMLEHHRNRQRMSAPDNPWGWRGGEGDTIDLVGLYVMSKESDTLQEGISNDSVIAIRTAMQGYHKQVSTPHAEYVEATYNMAHLQDAMMLMEESDAGQGVADSIRKRWLAAFAAVRDSKRALMLANQDVMDTLLEHVPESDFWKVRMEFVQKAYPDVFKKSSDITSMLTAANAIQNLNPTQKSTLETLVSTYRNEYWEICEQMIQNHQSNARASTGEGMMDKEEIHRKLQLETLRFQRKELNDLMQMRLRMVLNEEQVKDVPGLRPTVATGKEWNW